MAFTDRTNLRYVIPVIINLRNQGICTPITLYPCSSPCSVGLCLTGSLPFTRLLFAGFETSQPIRPHRPACMYFLKNHGICTGAARSKNEKPSFIPFRPGPPLHRSNLVIIIAGRPFDHLHHIQDRKTCRRYLEHTRKTTTSSMDLNTVTGSLLRSTEECEDLSMA